MAIRLTDEEIQNLLQEQKILPENFEAKMQLKQKRGHQESDLTVEGVNGSEFHIYLRQSDFNKLDFSVILTYRMPKSNLMFRLRRYNGKSHEHTNKIEGDTFYDFHIHTATEIYQEQGFKEESFAEVSDRYVNLQQAKECLFQDCNFKLPDKAQTDLFE